MGTPDYTSWLNDAWGWPQEYCDLLPGLSIANNIIVGTNPPYSVTDFLTLYPKFGGTPLKPTGTVVIDSNVIANLSSTTGLLPGQPIAGNGIPTGSLINSVSGSSVIISQNATANGGLVPLTVYSALVLPLAIINAYIYLATSSIIQARWCEMWFIAMGLFIAHYSEMWLIGEALTPNSTTAQIAASGLAIGIKTSKSVQDVSVGIQALDLDGWGSFQLTIYGQQLATLAKVIGSGIMVIY